MPPEYAMKIAATTDSKPTERFISAKNYARAVAHIVKDSVSGNVATTADTIRLTEAGVKLEVAE